MVRDKVNVQYVDASCISSEGELTWGAFRKNKHKSLKSFISVVSLAGLLPEGINDIYFKANNRHMIHPIAALMYAEQLGPHAVKKLLACLERLKGGEASLLSDEEAVKEDSEEKPKLETVAFDPKNEMPLPVTKDALGLPIQYPSFFETLNKSDRAMVELCLPGSPAEPKFSLVLDMDLTLLQVVISAAHAWTTSSEKDLQMVMYQKQPRLFEVMPGMLELLVRLTKKYNLYVLTASVLEVATLGKEDLFTGVVSVKTESLVSLKTFAAVGVRPELSVALDDVPIMWDPSCQANVIPAPPFGNPTKHQRDKEKDKLNGPWTPGLYLTQLEEMLTRAHAALKGRICELAHVQPSSPMPLVDMAAIVRQEMNRLFIKNQVKLGRYQKREGAESPPNSHDKRKRPNPGKEGH